MISLYKSIKHYIIKNYYLCEFEKGNVNALYELAIRYYNKQEIKMAMQYFNLAIEYGNNASIIFMIKYFRINNNYTEMKKYGAIAVKNKCAEAIYYMGHYYRDIEKNKNLMERYYLMAIDYGYTEAYLALGQYYYANQKDLAIFYLQQAINYGHNEDKIEYFVDSTAKYGNYMSINELLRIYKRYSLWRCDNYEYFALKKQNRIK